MVFGFLCSLVSLAVVGGLSRFYAQDSTAIERGFTMVWLIVGIFYGTLMPSMSRVAGEKTLDQYSAILVAISPNLVKVSPILLQVLNIFSYGGPAVGGMVVVGMMIRNLVFVHS